MIEMTLAILPFGNFASPQRARLIFLRNRHLSRRKAYDKTVLAVTSEVPKGNMASLQNFKTKNRGYVPGDGAMLRLMTSVSLLAEKTRLGEGYLFAPYSEWGRALGPAPRNGLVARPPSLS